MVQHRGRLQVQGRDLPGAGYSWSWDQRWPPRAQTGIFRLRGLRARLAPRQVAVRDEAFALAEQWVHRAGEKGGVRAVEPIFRTFQNRNLPARFADARVDLEVLAGCAFPRETALS